MLFEIGNFVSLVHSSILTERLNRRLSSFSLRVTCIFNFQGCDIHLEPVVFWRLTEANSSFGAGGRMMNNKTLDASIVFEKVHIHICLTKALCQVDVSSSRANLPRGNLVSDDEPVSLRLNAVILPLHRALD